MSRPHIVTEQTRNPSSIQHFVPGSAEVRLDEHPIYQELSTEEKERRKAYRKFVKGMRRSRNGMRGEMEGKIIYGSKAFLERAKALLGIEERVKARGRPKKPERYDK